MLSWHSGCYCVSWTFPHLLFLSAAASWSRVSFKNVVRLKRLFCSSGNKTSVLSADSRTSSSRLKKGTYTQERLFNTTRIYSSKDSILIHLPQKWVLFIADSFRCVTVQNDESLTQEACFHGRHFVSFFFFFFFICQFYWYSPKSQITLPQEVLQSIYCTPSVLRPSDQVSKNSPLLAGKTNWRNFRKTHIWQGYDRYVIDVA